jgi:alkylation response protein AidB-like acyl-CoA dehydrogenase
MDLQPSDEQRLLADTVDRLAADRYGFDARRRYAAEPDGWSRAMWASYAELGLLGLPFAEADGGHGGGAVEMMFVLEAFGRVLALEPYLATIVLAGAALRCGGSAEQRSRFVPAIARGSLLAAFAHSERDARHAIWSVDTTASRVRDGWEITGAKHLVLHGDCAELLVVSARCEGVCDSTDGIGLFLVDGAAVGLSKRDYLLRDGTRAADLRFDAVQVADCDVLGQAGAGSGTITHVVEAGIAAVAAEAVGAMTAVQALTLDYLRTREQFGRPIGQNQALQHRAADMLIALEQARSMAMLAAMMVDDPDPAERSRALSMVKVQIGASARQIGEAAIQLHGGIGMTEEYAVGHYLRRLMVIEQLFGDSLYHLGRLADGTA